MNTLVFALAPAAALGLLLGVTLGPSAIFVASLAAAIGVAMNNDLSPHTVVIGIAVVTLMQIGYLVGRWIRI